MTTNPKATLSEAFARLQLLVDNQLNAPPEIRWLAGIIGDNPSTYAKSPTLWNAAFRDLSFPGVSLPFDVAPGRLEAMVQALRETPQFLAAAVTVPYKVALMSLLDEVEGRARRIGAVNVVVRDSSGRLKGFNTDGPAAIESLEGRSGPDAALVPSLVGKSVLLIGAGGAARAVAVCVADAIGPSGRLTITNRDSGKARDLSAAIQNTSVSVVEDEALDPVLNSFDLVINCSTRGQAGWRKLPDGKVTCLEPYSALAPATPTVVDQADRPTASVMQEWFVGSLDDVAKNHERAGRRIARLNQQAAVFDLIYAPLETRLLADTRLSGRRGMNGKAMNITQAVLAFVDYAMKPHLATLGIDRAMVLGRVYAAMSSKW